MHVNRERIYLHSSVIPCMRQNCERLYARKNIALYKIHDNPNYRMQSENLIKKYISITSRY